MTGPAVVVWRDEVLLPSETFIVNQMAGLRRWTPLLAGLRRVPSVLDAEPVLVLAGSGRASGPHRRWLRWRRRSRRLAALLRRPEVRLVHAHFGRDGHLVAEEVRRAGLPLVVTFHGYDVTQLAEDPRTGARYRRQLAHLFADADALVAVSGFIRDRLLALGAPPEKVVTHFIGIPLQPLPDLPPVVARLFFVGRLVAKKGVADLLDAVGALPGHLRRTPVEVFGDGPLREQLEQRAEALGLAVTFHGHRPAAEVSRAYRAGGIFCGPSRRSERGDAEGLGMVFVEAAAAGLPVVAYRHGGVPEAVEDGVTGLLVPEGDVAALSAALARVLTDPALARRLGAAGRRSAEQRFDVVRQTALLEDLYDRLAPG